MTLDALVEALPDPERSSVQEVVAGDVDGVLSAATRLGFRAWTVRLEGVRGADALHDVLARTLEFPDWYGANWDAALDCLRDLSWTPAPGYVLVVRGLADLQAASPDDAATFVSVLDDASAAWSAEGRPFWGVLVVPGPARTGTMGA